jgi:hypothetical protein
MSVNSPIPAFSAGAAGAADTADTAVVGRATPLGQVRIINVTRSPNKIRPPASAGASPSAPNSPFSVPASPVPNLAEKDTASSPMRGLFGCSPTLLAEIRAHCDGSLPRPTPRVLSSSPAEREARIAAAISRVNELRANERSLKKTK